MKETLGARSGHQWDRTYMKLLGIKVTHNADAREFFGFDLPEAGLRQDDVNVLRTMDLRTTELIEVECRNKNNPPYVQEVLHALLQSLHYADMDENATDLVKALMRLVGIVGMEDFTMTSPKEMAVMMCGQPTSVNPDIIIHRIGSFKLLLVVQEKKVESGFPEPHLAASMIAAFGCNRTNYMMEHQTMYGIIVVGSSFSFYKCDIDTEIHSSIQMGYKQDKTIMNMIRFSLARPCSTEFMVESKQNMCATLKCFDAMRLTLVKKVETHSPGMKKE
jgi:hypothetical protein